MPQDIGYKVVTLDEGSGPVRAIKDAGGRIVSAEHIDLIRQKQEAELTQVTDLRDKLLAGDPDATAQVVGQVKDGLTRQLAMLERQKAEAAGSLAKLGANDAAAVADVVTRTAEQLTRRMELIASARDRSAQMLSDITTGEPGLK